VPGDDPAPQRQTEDACEYEGSHNEGNGES
jgi:hypothetical protein